MNEKITFSDLRKIAASSDLLLELSFPTRSPEYAATILRELEEIGVNGIYLVEKPSFSRLMILGKGYRGIVVRGAMRNLDVAVKILRTDSPLASLFREAEATKLANEVGVGPRLLGYSSHVLVLEFIDGVSIGDWLENLEYAEVDLLKNVLRKCFHQAKALDEIGLDHGELSDARKHIIVKRDLNPVIIDFGKSGLRKKPSNVTSLFSYLTYGPQSEKTLSMLEVSEPPINEVKEYKRRMDSESFEKLLQALNL